MYQLYEAIISPSYRKLYSPSRGADRILYRVGHSSYSIFRQNVKIIYTKDSTRVTLSRHFYPFAFRYAILNQTFFSLKQILLEWWQKLSWSYFFWGGEGILTASGWSKVTPLSRPHSYVLAIYWNYTDKLYLYWGTFHIGRQFLIVHTLNNTLNQIVTTLFFYFCKIFSSAI